MNSNAIRKISLTAALAVTSLGLAQAAQAAPAGPDLIVKSVATPPTYVKPGAGMKTGFVLTNISQSPAWIEMTTRTYIAPASTKQLTSAQLVRSDSHRFGAGGWFTKGAIISASGLDISTGSRPKGRYQVFTCVRGDSRVPESNTQNNCTASTPFTIGDPPAPVYGGGGSAPTPTNVRVQCPYTSATNPVAPGTPLTFSGSGAPNSAVKLVFADDGQRQANETRTVPTNKDGAFSITWTTNLPARPGTHTSWKVSAVPASGKGGGAGCTFYMK
jgi:hypothetical protein